MSVPGAPEEPPGLEARARANTVPLITGQAISLFGDYLALFTLPLFVLELTGRERDLGLTAAAETLPVAIFGLIAGVILDRVMLRRSLIFADLARALAFALLAAAVWAEAADLSLVLLVAFLVGTLSVLFETGLQALLPAAFTDNLLVAVNTKLQLAVTIATVAGPVAGGFLVATTGSFGIAFAFDAVTFLVSAAFLLAVRELRAREPRGDSSFWVDLRTGVAFLWKEPRLRWATLGAAAANFAFAPVAATLVLFAAEEIGLGKRSIGLYFAAFAAIAAVLVLAAPQVAQRLRLGRTVVVGLLMLGLGFLTVSFAGSFAAVLVPTGIAFAGVGWINIAITTLRQRLTPAPLLGRVIAASRTISWLGIPLGAAIGGYIADSVGVIPVYRFSAFAVLLVAGALVFTPLWRRPVAAIPEKE